MPYILGKSSPENAEQLMRSRYTAYALGHSQYLYQTYASQSKASNNLADIQDWAEQTTWLSLKVINHNIDDLVYQYVEFIAQYLVGNERWLMHETSRFIKEQQCWRYLDGDVTEHVLLSKINRNDTCPCLSGKKFKRCCMMS